MKQLLLRVDDDLHARLTERAKREHRSVNAIANEILSIVAAGRGRPDLERVRARASALGVLASPLRSAEPAENIDVLRVKAIESMRGAGEVLDSILDEDRDRLL